MGDKSSPKKIADIQISHFYNKVQTMAENLLGNCGDTLTTLQAAIDRWGQIADLREIFKLKEISAVETVELIKTLGNMTLFGNDRLDAISIKLAAESIFLPIYHLVNLSLIHSHFTNKWKLGRVIPLHKGKGLPRYSPETYSPITLLPVISKVVKRADHLQMTDFLMRTKQFNNNNQVYWHNYSTTTAIMQITYELYEAKDRNLISVIMTLDESFAFDCISHEIMDMKLELYNFHPDTRK